MSPTPACSHPSWSKGEALDALRGLHLWTCDVCGVTRYGEVQPAAIIYSPGDGKR